MKRIALIAVAALVAAAMAALFVGGCSPAGSSSQATYRQVSASEAMEMMKAESGYAIVDVRSAQEYAQGHIPDAINVPVESIGSAPPSELSDPDQLIMVYCRSGNRSKQAASALANLGYTNVVEFGGINAWPGEVV